MPIPQEEIDRHLNFLLTSSDPGDTIGGLHIVVAPIGKDGNPDVDKRETHIFALACDENAEFKPSQFAVLTIAGAALRYQDEKKMPLFAGIKTEAWAVEPFDELAEQMRLTGRPYSEHPNAGEITVVYAAARDGRRWDGTRWLTGPHAGVTEGPNQFTDPIKPEEGVGIIARAIRKLVGLPHSG